MTEKGIPPHSDALEADGGAVLDSGAAAAADNGWGDLLPRPGEIHEGPGLGLRHGGALALGGADVISSSIGHAPAMDRVQSSGTKEGPSLSLQAMRMAAHQGTERPLFR